MEMLQVVAVSVASPQGFNQQRLVSRRDLLILHQDTMQVPAQCPLTKIEQHIELSP